MPWQGRGDDNTSNVTDKIVAIVALAAAADKTWTEGNMVCLRTTLTGDLAVTLAGEAVVLGAGSASIGTVVLGAGSASVGTVVLGAGSATIGALTANQSVNNAQWIGSAAPTVGQKAMASSVPVVLPSDQAAFPVDLSTGPTTLNGLNQTVQVAVAGYRSVGCFVNVTNLNGTLTPEVSPDAGTTWFNGLFVYPTGRSIINVVYTGAGTTDAFSIPLFGGMTHARVRVSAFTSGSAAVTIKATTEISSNTLAAGPRDSYLLPFNSVSVAASDGTNLRAILADTAGRLQIAERRAATLHVTATAAVNTAVTATLPAPGAGLFHYITSIELRKQYSIVGVAAGAGVVITSTNLPGTPAWITEQLASPAGTNQRVIEYRAMTPLRSSVANTATTFVAPAQLQTIWRWNISYFTAV